MGRVQVGSQTGVRKAVRGGKKRLAADQGPRARARRRTFGAGRVVEQGSRSVEQLGRLQTVDDASVRRLPALFVSEVGSRWRRKSGEGQGYRQQSDPDELGRRERPGPRARSDRDEAGVAGTGAGPLRASRHRFSTRFPRFADCSGGRVGADYTGLSGLHRASRHRGGWIVTFGCSQQDFPFPAHSLAYPLVKQVTCRRFR